SYFSSRRRHTRFSRDWSSDVCSSDLTLVQVADHFPGIPLKHFGIKREGGLLRIPAPGRIPGALVDHGVDRQALPAEGVDDVDHRSEERRVGKACSFRSLMLPDPAERR